MPGGVPRKYARRGTDEGHQGQQGPNSIFLWTVGSSIHWIEHQNQAVADAGSEHFAVCSRSSCVASERRGNAGKVQNRALRHIARSLVHVSRERTQDLRKRLGVHTVVSTLQVRRLLWAKKWLREETYPEDERTGAGEAMSAMVFGRPVV